VRLHLRVWCSSHALMTLRAALVMQQAPALVCVLGCVLGVPMMAGVILVPSFWAALGFYFFEYLFAESWFGPSFALLQSLVPSDVVGVATSAFVCASMLVREFRWVRARTTPHLCCVWLLSCGCDFEQPALQTRLVWSRSAP